VVESLDALERGGHVDAVAEDGRQRIRHLVEARGQGLEREARGIEARRHLVPLERAGGGGAG
jgi:hypothetical protein